MLESLDRTNIGSLTLEEPKSNERNSFKAKRDITNGRWQEVFRTLDELFDVGRDYQMYDIKSNIKLIAPEVERDLRIEGETANTFQIYQQSLRYQNRENAASISLLSQLRVTKVLLQESFKDICGQASFAKYHTNSKVLWSRNPSNIFFFEDLRDLKIVFPDRQANIDFDWEEAINGYPQVKLNQSSDDLVMSLSGLLAGLKVVDEERFKKVRVTSLMWKDFHSGLAKETDIGIYMQIAANLAIISAEKVVLTEDEFYLSMPEEQPDFNQPTPALPEMRKF
ncbi:MAG: hypothetical protein Q7R49_01915 [Candidatus Daviesbacteria bacterium]|nr:hypothetical protein [Candidatus Daviesbacteria bacterium]